MASQLLISPNRIVSYRTPKRSFGENKQKVPRLVPKNNQRKINQISPKGKTRLKQAINWLSFLSLPRAVKWQGQVKDRNFQIAFITLTLPSKQMHSHSEIVKSCLNTFLMYLRRKHNVENYVWRAELQANGNIHFHLVIDRYIHYLAVRKYWNNSIATLGYLSAYADLFRNMKYADYLHSRQMQGTNDLSKIRKAWKYGQDTGWLMPNTTDVEKPRDIQKIGAYLSKYFSKNNDEEKTGMYADSLKELTGRLWYCSTSLSRLKGITIPLSPQFSRIFHQIKSDLNNFYFEGDYFQVLFYNIQKIPPKISQFLTYQLHVYASRCSYNIPI